MLKQVRAVSMGLQTLNICDYFKKINLLTGKCFRESIRFAWTSLFWFFGPPPPRRRSMLPMAMLISDMRETGNLEENSFLGHRPIK